MASAAKQSYLWKGWIHYHCFPFLWDLLEGSSASARIYLKQSARFVTINRFLFARSLQENVQILLEQPAEDSDGAEQQRCPVDDKRDDDDDVGGRFSARLDASERDEHGDADVR